MKKKICLLLFPFTFLAYLGSSAPDSAAKPPKHTLEAAATNNITSEEPASKAEPGNIRALIDYAFTFMGSPYVYAGISPEGFDCSGFTKYVFQKFGVSLPHSSGLQATTGVKVDRHKARLGDVVIFTGTNPSVRKPGHVGIVISSPGDTITFIHASSNGGVKVSKVEGTRYNTRFLEIRRVIDKELKSISAK
ncbi:C40 family peptidase [Pontibacter harenae]|uniref:C40 family peptidase n=1 Tax=Pontibacter harenae TaxID=2894083 RepID=UPI001E4C1084|nr:C40 family peptidase [Pontibacter harenae]MCC9167480.1 C40 family peptidase [Pontibacter harenae]